MSAAAISYFQNLCWGFALSPHNSNSKQDSLNVHKYLPKFLFFFLLAIFAVPTAKLKFRMGKSIRSIPVRLEPKICYNLQEAADQAVVELEESCMGETLLLLKSPPSL